MQRPFRPPPTHTHTHTPRFSTPTLHVINLFKYGFLSFRLAIMPILVIHNIWAVGMHHWGARELEVGSGYVLELDKHNPKDKNAVQIMGGGGSAEEGIRQTRERYRYKCIAMHETG